MRTRSERNLTGLTIVVVITAVVGALPTKAVASAEPDDAYDLQRAAWVEAGRATDPHDLLPKRVTSRQNAATYYLRAGAMMEQLPAADLTALRSPRSTAMLVALGPRLEHIRTVLEKGWACETCVWPINVDDPRELYPSSQEYAMALNDVTRVCWALILSEGEAGRPEEAMRLVECSLEMAADFYTAPVAMRWFAKFALHQTALNAYRDVFVDVPLPKNDVMRYLEEADIEREYLQAAELEVAAWIAAYERGFFDELLTDGKKQQAARAELAWLLEMTSRALEGDLEAVLTTQESTRPSPRVLFKEDQPPMPWFVMFGMKRYRSTLMLSQLGVELREYKAEHGEYPETHDMPIDPATDKPFLYTKTDDGCVITSQQQGRRPIEWRWEENAGDQW